MYRLNIIIILLMAVGCATTNKNRLPPFVIGELDKAPTIKMSKDSIHLLTPAVEMYHRMHEYNSEIDQENREILRESIIELQQAELFGVKYYELPFVYSDYRTVNSILEYQPYYKFLNPEKIVVASPELIVQGEKYGLIFSVTARHGYQNHIILSLLVINNSTKTIDYVIRYTSRSNPMNKAKVKKLMRKALMQIMELT